LRELFLKDTSTSVASKKIYVKRMTNRKIVNEEEFELFIKKYGFEVHVMEGLSIKQQAELFNESCVII